LTGESRAPAVRRQAPAPAPWRDRVRQLYSAFDVIRSGRTEPGLLTAIALVRNLEVLLDAVERELNER
jgi:hypothetical protein